MYALLEAEMRLRREVFKFPRLFVRKVDGALHAGSRCAHYPRRLHQAASEVHQPHQQAAPAILRPHWLDRSVANSLAVTSFWTGRSCGSLEEINGGAERWCLRVAGLRDHGTTHAPPLLVFQAIEQPAMLALPTTPAKVGRDCHAQVQQSLDSIPSRYVGQRLDVRIGAKLVRFYAGTELAKTHLRGQPGQRQTDWEDYPPEQAAFFQRTPTWCRERASRLGEHVRAAVDELLDQHHLQYLRQSQGILRLAEKYGQARLDAACQRALAYGNAHYRTIRTILEKGLEPHLAEPAPPSIASVGAYLRGPGALVGLTTPVQEEIPA